MSVFPFASEFPIGTLGKITGNTATTIVDGAIKTISVARLQISENSGGTQNLTVALTDGTTIVYLGSAAKTWKAQAVTAYLSLEFGEVVVPYGWTLKVTSSDASGHFDYFIISGPVA